MENLQMARIIPVTNFHIYLEEGDEIPQICRHALCQPPKNAAIHFHLPAKALPGKGDSPEAAELNGRFLGELERAGNGRSYGILSHRRPADAPETKEG